MDMNMRRHESGNKLVLYIMRLIVISLSNFSDGLGKKNISKIQTLSIDNQPAAK